MANSKESAIQGLEYTSLAKAAYQPLKMNELTALDKLLNTVDSPSEVTLVHGRAGTGKSTLIREFMERTSKVVIVLAPTGIAASNIGGQTIHSFFRFPWLVLSSDDLERKDKLAEILEKIELIIVDEVSMVRADVMDAIDHSLRLHRRGDLPFGGLKIVLVGDFFQLPPVVTARDRRNLRYLGYRRHNALASHCLSRAMIEMLILEKVHRQSDQNFLDVLARIRRGKSPSSAIDYLNERCVKPLMSRNNPVVLTFHREIAERYNREGLERLPGEPNVFRATCTGKWSQEEMPQAPLNLTVKQGARIMMVSNDAAKRWFNGSLGLIEKFKEDVISVRIDGSEGDVYEVGMETWKNHRQEWNREKNKLEKKEIGSFTQFPLQPAWAITVHKAQGLTLDNVRIDLERRAFSSGQVYVALSRVRRIEHLSFTHPLMPSDVRVDREIETHLARLAQANLQFQ